MAIDNNSTGNTILTPPDTSQAGSAPATGWPGAFGLFKYSKAAVSVNLIAILIIWLFQFVIVTVVGLIDNESIASSIQLVVGVFVQAALVLTYLASVRGKKVSAGEKLSQGSQFFVQLLLLQLLVALSVFIGLLLFIVPGIILLTRLFVAEYYLIDKNMGAVEAYKASLAATKGNTGKVWGIFGATLLMSLIAITIIGIPVAIYLVLMYSAANALLYQYLSSGSLGPQEGPNIQAPAQAPLTPPDTASNFAFNQPEQTVAPQAPQQPQAQPTQSPLQPQPTPQQNAVNNPSVQPTTGQVPVDPQNPQV